MATRAAEKIPQAGPAPPARPRRSPRLPAAAEVGEGSLIGDGDFQLFQKLVHREAGIWLAPAKKALLVGRLAKRLRALEIGDYGQYYRRVETDPVEQVRMLDCICTNETGFFREPRHFHFLETELAASWRAEADAGARPRRVRAWSAACSTGEEPYSLAMSLLAAFPPQSGWEVDILATDLSTRALERAQAAVWPMEKSREIAAPYLKAFMLRGVGSQEGLMKAGPEIRSVVRFARLNLNQRAWPGLGRFDLVFCRNVLIYFDPPTKDRVVVQILGHLDPNGHLFLGHAESLSGMADRFRPVLPTIYAHAGQAHAGGAASSGQGRAAPHAAR